MSKYWSDTVKGLTPYVPGEQPKEEGLVKLNTNENPFAPSPRVLAALHQEMDPGDGASLRLYPDPNADALKAAIAALHGVEPRNVFVGNGSDEVLAHTFVALLKHARPLLFPDITYSFYAVYCGLFGIDYEKVPLAPDFTLRVDDYLRPERQPNGGIIFANPNAPTGIPLPRAEVERLVRTNVGSPVVVDEAYVDFGGESVIDLVTSHPNLLVVRTFSKSRALAGLRVGYAVGDAALIDGLERVKNSFNSYPVDRLAQAAALASLTDETYFERARQAVVASRERMAAGLRRLGLEVLPSATNFVFARHPGTPGAALAAALRARKVLVRHFKAPRIEDFLRISVGTDRECDALLATCGDALRELGGTQQP